jgi:TonB family protein
VTTAAVVREPVTPAKPTMAGTADQRAAPQEPPPARPIAQQAAPAATPSAPVAPARKPVIQSTEQPAVTEPVVVATVAESVPPPAAAQPVKPTPPLVKPVQDPAVVMLALNSRARSAFAEGRLVKPADNSVVYWLQKMRAAAPSADATRAVAVDLQAALLARAEEAVVLGDVDEAVRWTGLAADNGAEAIRLLEMRRLIDYVSAQNSPAVAAAVNVADDTTVVATATVSATVTAQKSVPLSNFEFVSYVEPNYPAQAAADNEAGWVDVRFTVGKDGRTHDIEVVGRDLPQPFEAPSIAAVEQWRFKPYESDGAIRAANSAVRLRFGD